MARTISDGNISFMMFFVCVFYAVLTVRLCHVQCFREPTSKESESGQEIRKSQQGFRHERLVHLPQQRGQIFDRNRVPLTGASRYYKVFIDAKALAEEQQLALATNVALWFPEIDADTLNARISANRETNRRFDVVGTTSDDLLAEHVRNLGRPGKPFRGLGVQECYTREYPMLDEASQIVGFVNNEGIGIAGIEMQYNRLLTGAPGHKWCSVNALGHEIRHLRDGYLAPRNGVDIELTIDSQVQHIVNEHLDKAWRETRSLAAWALVYDCQTGEVLAMVSRPTLNPLEFRTSDLETWKNRCVSFRYEPGSVMKPVTISGALSAGVVTPRTSIDTGRGPWHFGGYPLRDHFDGPGVPRDFIRKSSNKGTAMIALRMGRDLLSQTLLDAGFGRRTGIELPAEDPGNLGRPNKWTELNLTRISIGQSVDVTALQLACAYGAIANHGIRMRPHIIQRIFDPNSQRVLKEFHPEPVPEPVFQNQATRDMLGMLEAVVIRDPDGTHGTGRKAAISGYRVGGKTGTAQMLINRRYSNHDYHASFCGLLPIDNPRYAIVVTLERPIGPHGGGDVAAPVFAQIAQDLACYYKLPTDLVQTIEFETEEFIPEDLEDSIPERDPELDGYLLEASEEQS